MKLTNKHFAIFKKECKKWLKEFELSNWSIVYQFGDFDDEARVERSSQYNATIGLDNEIDTQLDRDMSTTDYIKSLAKHECLHLLLGRLAIVCSSRQYTETECTEEEESLVRKLTNIIK